MKKFYKRLLMLCGTTLLCANAYAEQISENTALSIANDFLSQGSTSTILPQSSNRLKLAYTAKSTTDLDKNCFYVFNRGSQEGFIIVAADDCTNVGVLGVCSTGEFDNENIPSNFKWWLEQYQREIDYAMANNLQATPAIRTFATSVSPLLGNIEWNQGDPYNLLCPTLTNSSGETERTVTGCVATATAQVMRYYKYPANGIGSNSYEWENGGQTLTVDFSQSTYDWDNMTETYNSSSSDVEKNAVAKLMYDCGISCNMDYNLSSKGGSGASALDQASGLYNHFGYDIGMEHVSRNYYKLSEWENMIINEIDNKRPILYRGTGSGGGHAFIIDGYNSNGYFHFNWGWGGSANGYFLTTALNPKELGIGGGAGGYNYNQGMTIGVQPAQSSSVASTEITCDGLEISGDATNGFSISANKVKNSNWQAATFVYGYLVEATDGTSKTYVRQYNITDLPSYNYYNALTIEANKLAQYFNDGEYKVSIVVKPTTTGTWESVHTLLGAYQQIYMTVADGVATNLSYEQSSLPNLSVAGYTFNDKLYANRVATVYTKVKNSGGEYLGDMAIVVTDKSGNIIATSGLLIANIAEGETKDVIFEYSMFTLADGVTITEETPCTMYLYGDASEESIFLIGELGDVTMYPIGDGTPALAFTKKPVVNSAKTDNVSLTLNLINNGAVFKDAITIYTWDKTLNNEYCGGISNYAMIESGEEKELTFSFPYDGIVGHTYLVNIYANNAIIKGNTSSINYVCTFTLEEGLSGIGDIEAKVETTVINHNNTLEISTQAPINAITVYSSTGAIVAHSDFSGNSNSETISLESQQAGIYIINISTTDGVKNSKVLIK